VKAVAVFPGKANSAHLAELQPPDLNAVPNGRGVLVRVLRVGVDGTDKEINAAEYGAAPAGYDFLVTGHEGFGRVEAVGEQVWELKPGDYVVATVRRPGTSLYDKIGMSDMTTDDSYFERGISRLHGFLTEYYADDAEYIVKIPNALRMIGVLLEPFTVVQKGVAQAYEAQRRMRVWRPQRAAVMGAGTIGLLAALALRLRGLHVTVFALEPKPNHRAGLIEEIGAEYFSTPELSIADASGKFGSYDLIFEATGASPVVFESMKALAKNGALVLASVTGGHRNIEVPADRINLEFVLGNKLMLGTVNANRDDFQSGVRDFALAEAEYAGWLSKLLTHPVLGLESFAEAFDHLERTHDAIKVFYEVVPGWEKDAQNAPDGR
jgi:glucose 1-dehydrogenase